jgi:plastocyanin
LPLKNPNCTIEIKMPANCAVLQSLTNPLALACIVVGSCLYSASSIAQTQVVVNVFDAQRKPVSNAVVTIRPLDAATKLPSRLTTTDGVVNQIDREFVPRVSVLPVGSKVSFPNRDVVQHSVYSFSKTKTFDIPIYAGASPQVITLDKPGVIVLGCNIHDWMVGYIVVVDTPIAEMTKDDGSATANDIPKGSYSVRVWHSQMKAGEWSQNITVNEAGQQRVDVVLDLAPARARYKPPLNIKRYD